MKNMADRRVMEGRRVADGSLASGVLQDRISGEVGWQQKSYPLDGDGTHALVWVYSKDSNDTDGSDRGWVDYLQWTPSGGGGGSSTTDWEQITYTYDPSGRRIAKDVDGVVTRYVYDGDQCIAEYDGSNNLLRKYIHGPCIDEPICMIEAAGGYAGTYYYHFDALGSVVALSDADGDTVQVYEYDVYGQVAASDPNHPNRFMFTGREFDTETGLYYYRARYYNASIGRFLQTDPIAYSAGLNMYAYCGNNPAGCVDPSGCLHFAMSPVPEGETGAGIYIRFTVYNDDGSIAQYQDEDGNWLDAIYDACGVGDGCRWLAGLDAVFSDEYYDGKTGWNLSGKDQETFWNLMAISQLGCAFDYAKLEEYGVAIDRREQMSLDDLYYDASTNIIVWSSNLEWYPSYSGEPAPLYCTGRDIGVKALAHELQHAWDDISGANFTIASHCHYSQWNAIRSENIIMQSCIGLAPKAYRIGERRGRDSVYTVQDYMRPGGYATDQPAPKPPWGSAL